MLLGDGSIHKAGAGKTPRDYSYYFSMAHSINQEDFLLWKASLIDQCLADHSSDRHCSISRYLASTNNRRYRTIKASLGFKHFLEPLRNIAYKNGKKDYSYLLSEATGDRSLAIWMMDDGSEDRRKDSQSPRYLLHVYSLSPGEINLSLEWLRHFNLEGRKVLTKSGPRIAFRVSETERIFSLIKPFLAPLQSMRNKFRRSFDLWDVHKECPTSCG